MVDIATTVVGSMILVIVNTSSNLFCMPLYLTLFAAWNLIIDFQNVWAYQKRTTLEWWNILFGILSILGIIPSFILVLPGFIGMIVTLLLTPIWLGLEVLSVVAFIIYIFIDPSMMILAPIIRWVYCIFGLTSYC